MTLFLVNSPYLELEKRERGDINIFCVYKNTQQAEKIKYQGYLPEWLISLLLFIYTQNYGSTISTIV